MAQHQLNGLRVAILATNGFEEAELLEPWAALEKTGAKISVIAPKGGKIYGMKHHDKAGEVNVNQELAQANPDDFDAVMLPGGALNADALRIEKHAQDFVTRMDTSGRP